MQTTSNSTEWRSAKALHVLLTSMENDSKLVDIQPLLAIVNEKDNGPDKTPRQEGGGRFTGKTQQDSNELFSLLMSLLPDSVTRSYRFVIRTYFKCPTCTERPRERVDTLRGLEVPLLGGCAAESVDAYFAREEVAFLCPGCNNDVLGTRRTFVETAPRMLHVSFNQKQHGTNQLAGYCRVDNEVENVCIF